MAVDKIINLIKRANESGISVLYEQNNLKLKFVKGSQVDQALVQELKMEKYHIIAYLRQIEIGQSEVAIKIKTCDKMIEFNGQFFYKITPIQEYWINENKDRGYKENESRHGVINLIYLAKGNLSVLAFKEAIQFVVKRHESLRSTFHNLERGKYGMKVESEDSIKYRVGFKDVRNDLLIDANAAEKYIRFDGHQFSFNEGPLFLCNVAQIGKRNFAIGIKIHHIIWDSLSNDILLNDIFRAYNDISSGYYPRIEPLKFQYKDFLASIANNIEKNAIRDKKYWNELYCSLPPVLELPGTRGELSERPMLARIRRRRQIRISSEMTSEIGILAGKHSTSIFVVLQTIVKLFLFFKTGQNDLLIGTIISGRENEETHNQIGCYAQTMVIRTVLDANDTFTDAIRRVKKSNYDMLCHSAYTLTDAINERLQDGKSYEEFWKVNILYSDISNVFVSKNSVQNNSSRLDVEFRARIERHNALMPIDFILEFLKMPYNLELDWQYDGSLYDDSSIEEISKEFIDYIGMLIKTKIALP